MSLLDIGEKLVRLSRENKGLEAVEMFYDEKIVSMEAEDTEALPARTEGIQAVREKNAWWYENHEIHASRAEGPFRGPREDQFGVFFEVDVTFKPSGERTQMSELGIYTVEGDRIVHEEFWSRLT